MKYYYAINYSYLITALLPVIAGVLKFKGLDKAGKILLTMLVFSFLGEIIAFSVAVSKKNNLAIYNISSLIEMFLVAIYFNYTIDSFKKYYLGFLLAAVSIFVDVLILSHGQSLYKVNNVFMVYQGIIVICISMMYLAQLLNKFPIMEFPYLSHFWFATLFIFFWTLTLLNWASYDYLSLKLKEHKYPLDLALMVVAAITYIGFAATFFIYPSKKKGYGD